MPPSPENEPESRPNAEPSPESEIKPTAEPEGMGEPFPEWSTAVREWGGAWHFHQYGLGTLFCLLALLAAASLVYYHRTPARGRKKVPSIILSLLVLLGLTRGLFLTLDAYRSKKVVAAALLNVLWAVGQPCIVTAYALVFIVLRNAVCLQQKFQAWYTTRNIALTMVPYFVFALTSELVTSFLPKLKGLTFACQVLGTTFNALLAVFYSFLAFLLGKKLKNALALQTAGTRDRGGRIRITQRICMAVALGGIVISVMNIYAVSGVYGIFSEAAFVAAWPWFGFMTFFRLMELYMAVLLYLVAMQRSTRTRKIDIVPSAIVSTGGKVNNNVRLSSAHAMLFRCDKNLDTEV